MACFQSAEDVSILRKEREAKFLTFYMSKYELQMARLEDSKVSADLFVWTETKSKQRDHTVF